jgi:hypothetical protein
MKRDYLFFGSSLYDRLCRGHRGATDAVQTINEAQFLASSDDEIVDHVKAQWIVQPLTLHEDAATMNQCETDVDVSGDPNRLFFPEDRGPHYVPGTEVTIQIPYTGTTWLWQAQTSTSTSIYPVGTVQSAGNKAGTITLKIVLAHDAPKERFKQLYDDNVKLIRQYIEWGTTEIDSYNQQLDGVIRNASIQRRQRLKQHGDITALLNIPLQEKAGVPALQRIPIEIRKPPPLAVPPKDGIKPEPGIDNSVFEKILDVIRHEGRSFETAPTTFAKFDEEELRDILLAHLNGHFKGAATGETFRRKGKTDIRIEDENRSAFVAECKVWGGAGEVTRAIGQLLSYLTWRDSKAALVVFNKAVAGFSELPGRMRHTVLNHPFFVKEMSINIPGEYRFLMRSEEDPGRRVIMHAYLFNLYCR